MTPTLLNLPYLPGHAAMGPGGAAAADLVSPTTVWLIILAVLAIYGTLMNILATPPRHVGKQRRTQPRAPKRLIPRET